MCGELCITLIREILSLYEIKRESFFVWWFYQLNERQTLTELIKNCWFEKALAPKVQYHMHNVYPLFLKE